MEREGKDFLGQFNPLILK